MAFALSFYAVLESVNLPTEATGENSKLLNPASCSMDAFFGVLNIKSICIQN
jgi:hypothetical protein